MVRKRGDQDRASSRDPGEEFGEAEETEKGRPMRLQGPGECDIQNSQDILLQREDRKGVVGKGVVVVSGE